MAPVAVENNAVTADGRHEKRMTNYTKFWQQDMSKEKDVDTSNRLESYTEVVNGKRDNTRIRVRPILMSVSRLL